MDVDLADFDLIDPCGMPGLVSTSIAAERGRPDDGAVHGRRRASRGGRSRLPSPATWDAPLDGDLPPHADPAAERAALERLAAAVPA